MLVKLTLLFVIVLSAATVGIACTAQKPYILHLSGSCSPGHMSIEYFITGAFGGYSGFVKTDPRFDMYDIPTVRNGSPARTLKIIVRGARCRTQMFDIPEVEKDGRVIRARLRRSRQIEFRGVIRSNEITPNTDNVLTAEYWADWKCSFFGIADCLIGPTRIAAVDIEKDGEFRLFLPDFANDPSLTAFAEKGSFQFFIRDRKTGSILYNLNSVNGAASLPVASAYSKEYEFNAAAPVAR
jgi:hypothetical protein